MGSRKERTPRKSGILRQEKSKWLVVCEGTKTEPNYLKGVIEFMNTKIPQDMQLDVTITGMGMNTTSLVDKAMELQNLVDSKKREVLIPYKYTIVVFDKDSFSDNDFNKAIQMCEKEGYIACWSNQAIEYFFLLHFFYCDSGIDRKDYKQKIDEQLASHGCSQKYQKNLLKIFHIFYQYGDLLEAIKRAKKIHEKWLDKKESPAKCESCTTMYRFFDLIDFRNEELSLPSVKELFQKKKN